LRREGQSAPAVYGQIPSEFKHRNLFVDENVLARVRGEYKVLGSEADGVTGGRTMGLFDKFFGGAKGGSPAASAEINITEINVAKDGVFIDGGLQIDKRLAAEVEELYLDGGNEIYLQVCPLWDGEDKLFDIKSIEEAELAQFRNLKKIDCVMMDFNKKTRELLQGRGIEIVE
jgi:hypothetical protein